MGKIKSKWTGHQTDYIGCVIDRSKKIKISQIPVLWSSEHHDLSKKSPKSIACNMTLLEPKLQGQNWRNTSYLIFYIWQLHKVFEEENFQVKKSPFRIIYTLKIRKKKQKWCISPYSRLKINCVVNNAPYWLYNKLPIMVLWIMKFIIS